MSSVWKDLLFMHGHITDPRILESATPATPPVTGKVVQLPTPQVRKVDAQRDPAIFAKGWQECA